MTTISPPKDDPAAAVAPAGGSASSSGIEVVREYARVFWGYKWVVLAVTVAVSAAVVFWTLKQPRIYQATVVIEYDPNIGQPLGNEVADVSGGLGSYWLNQEFFATQNRVIQSRTVAEQVVRDMHLHRKASFFYVSGEGAECSAQSDCEAGFNCTSGECRFRPRRVSDAARVLQSRLTVEPVIDTRLVNVRVTDRNARRAAELANAIAEAYRQKTLRDRIGSTDRAIDDLGTQRDRLRVQLADAEIALHSFKREHNVLSVSMEDRQNLVASDIEHFNQSLTKARTQRIEMSARVERMRVAARAETPEDAAAAFPDNDTITSLREQLRTKLAEREGLASRYGAGHQRMQQIDGEIADMRRQLQVEINGVIRAAEADVAEVRHIENGLRAALDDAHAAGLELNLREIEYGRLNRDRENYAKLYGILLERSTETDVTRRLSPQETYVRILDEALEPGSPVSPSLTKNSLGGFGAGLGLGLAVALLLSFMDRRLRSVAEVERMGMTVLGILPRIEEGEAAQPPPGKRRRREPIPKPSSRDLFVHTHPMSAAAECCRTIRTNLTFMSADEPLRTIVVTSANPREGKTTVTTNIAISLAQSGKRVLMVDTDLRRPRIHRAFGVPGARGVTSVIVGEERFENVVQPTDIPNLDVLPCGPIPPNPSELFHSQRFADLVEEAKRRYDRVIFDSPPLAAVTDAAVLAPQVDAALMVIKSYTTTRDALASALRQLNDVGANVVGGVLNDLDPRRKGYGTGDYYYYYRREGYYYSSDDENAAESEERPPDAPPPA